MVAVHHGVAPPGHETTTKGWRVQRQFRFREVLFPRRPRPQPPMKLTPWLNTPPVRPLTDPLRDDGVAHTQVFLRGLAQAVGVCLGSYKAQRIRGRHARNRVRSNAHPAAYPASLRQPIVEID